MPLDEEWCADVGWSFSGNRWSDPTNEALPSRPAPSVFPQGSAGKGLDRGVHLARMAMPAGDSPFDRDELVSRLAPRPGRDLVAAALEDAVAVFAERHGLTPTEAAILAETVRGLPPAGIRERLGKMSVGTYQTHATRVRAKCRVRRLADARDALARWLFGVEAAAPFEARRSTERPRVVSRKR